MSVSEIKRERELVKQITTPIKSIYPCISIYLSIPLFIHLLTGFLRDRLGSYDEAFYLAGIPPIIGGAVLCLIPWLEARRKRREKEEALSRDQDVTKKMLETEKTLEHKKAQEAAQSNTGESVL